MLQINSISFFYQEPLFQDVSFEIGKGEIIGIVGDSGAGKTTLLKVIAGLLDASSGEVVFENETVYGPAKNLIPGHEEIKLVNQDFNLDLYHTVKENIKEKVLHLPKLERDELVEELLDLTELNHRSDQKAILLSGGEQQRLALARAMAGEPKLLLLDEPFVHLDGRLRMKISNYLLQMKDARDMSIILVSHDGGEILSFTDRIIHFSNGKINRIASPLEFYFLPNSYKEAEFFGIINSVHINNNEILFRPTEFELVNDAKEISIKIKFLGSQFAGTHFVNYFQTVNDEKIILFHNKSLDEEKEIIIKKRNTSSIMG